MAATRFSTGIGLALLALGALALPACRRSTDGDVLSAIQKHPAKRTLVAFQSDQEIRGFLKSLADEQKKRAGSYGPADGYGYAQPSGAPAPAPAAEAAEPASKASDSKADSESVTNVQHAGVDEGGIVKTHGDHLVVLRRGRLFTVRVAGGALEPVAQVDAYGPEIDPGGTWYDEMLLSKNTIAVIGYSYERGGTEIGLFDINSSGGLRYRATYHLRSNDYYSSRNYASRLIGDKLIFYTPLYLDTYGDDPFKGFPALRKWHKGATEKEFTRIASATRVYRPVTKSASLALHTVTICDLGRRELECEATAVMGPAGRVFYVSPSSVYVWMTDWETEADRARPKSLVYRLPLDGSGPSALRVAGSPVDQFSFLESSDGFLNVVVRSDAAGEAMWSSESVAGEVALLRTELESFSDGADAAPVGAYHRLPRPPGYTFQNRFVGDHLLYGTGSGWGSPEQEAKQSAIYVYRYAGGASAAKLGLPHGVDRIEALGNNAVAVGTDGKDLHFSPVSLRGRPSLATRYTRKNASQGELRSHGFFYKSESEDSGLLGLPIAEAGRPGYEHLFENSASVLFLKNDALRLGELGTLRARPERAADDGCRASCVDWYGNARPLFLKGRLFALLGYEIVEGEIADGRVRELRRATFAPSSPKIAR